MANRSNRAVKGGSVFPETAADLDRICMALVGVRATIITTKITLQGNGVFDYVACNLDRGALAPIEALLAEFQEVRSARIDEAMFLSKAASNPRIDAYREKRAAEMEADRQAVQGGVAHV